MNNARHFSYDMNECKSDRHIEIDIGMSIEALKTKGETNLSSLCTL